MSNAKSGTSLKAAPAFALMGYELDRPLSRAMTAENVVEQDVAKIKLDVVQ